MLYDVTRRGRGCAGRLGGRGRSGSTARSGSGCTPSTASVTAWVYVLDAYEGGLPSARYLGIMADAAEVAGAPDDYVRRPALAGPAAPIG